AHHLLCSENLSRETEDVNDHVDGLYPNKRNDYSSQSVEPQIASEYGLGPNRTILDSSERKWNQCDDDQRIEYHSRENRRLRCLQSHDVQCGKRTNPGARYRVQRRKDCRNNREILGNIISD